MPSLSLVLSACALTLAYVLYKRFTRISLSHVKGPESSSFLYGNFPELLQSQAGEKDFEWQKIYGDVIRIHAPLGGERLFITDPKALSYIYQSGYNFIKSPSRSALSRITLGPGLLNVEGEQHRRQRKIMTPGFGSSEAKAFVPVFLSYASKMANKWRDMISMDATETITVDIPEWTSRATLDAIGEAAFDYQFGALDNAENELTNTYTNLVFTVFGIPKPKDILALSIMDMLPDSFARFIVRNAPSPRFEVGRRTNKLTTRVAKQLVAEKYAALKEGKASKDLMSLMVKANASGNPDMRLEEDELLAQMNIIVFAGHETTSNTLSFALLELVAHPECQTKLRQEIRETQRKIHAVGRDEFTAADFDAMPYLTAVVKETLRMHPVVYNVFRIATKDDVLPLHKPITTKTGEVLTELPIPAGLQVISSIAGYNRSKEVFGEDADVFNPERWLRKEGKPAVSLGVYGNTFTFVGGQRSCLGWRFAVMELHSFIVELVNSFEFSLTDGMDVSRVRRESCFFMLPTIEGEQEKGSQLHMKVRVAPSDED
ncbi:cytochrome P450 [Armillaria gallica]|uniref:Cytochrome P450 n=1 Tax=Armillaria gallica TaxID=47427 RepID=A0A2H3DEM5_ARMGA|nr:cytochrome P450 [Armillaria gallica]